LREGRIKAHRGAGRGRGGKRREREEKEATREERG